ncbi:MAG: YdiU family protein [Myxococcota bacterium]
MQQPPAIPALEHRYAQALSGLYVPWQASPFPAPRLLVLNAPLAAELGLDADRLASPAGIETLVGQRLPEGAKPLAMAYAGHQFGHYSPRLGDGRALLMGELLDREGRLRDVHLKGSGRTPFARGGDGKAVVGPMLREYLISEAMHALGVPTTRSLAVVATGETVARDEPSPGALLVRVAASHLRVGTFELAAASGDPELLERLLHHAIARHCPEAARAERPALALYDHVLGVQAELVARWMQLGFVHGVMNTDNTTISGETIDYGPCAFLDRHGMQTVFSSIDQGGRYAYGNQPGILQWNLARFAEAILPLLDPDPDRAVALATEALERYAERFRTAWRRGLAAKLGVPGLAPDDERVTRLVDGLLERLAAQRVDHTLFFRRLSEAVRGDATPVRALFDDPDAFETWAGDWSPLLPSRPDDRRAVALAMDRINPIFIPRNHRVEEALAAATEGDLAPFHALLDVVTHPFDARPGLERFAEPAAIDAPPHRTFCGT